VRLDKHLAERLGSRAAAQAAITEGRVTVDGVVRQKSFQVTGEERIEVADAEPGIQEVPESASVPVVFEDDDLLVVDKPAGLVVHPGSAVKTGTLVQLLGDRVAGGEDPDRRGVVHRLDRDTSGLLILTKTQAAFETMTEAIRERRVEREYVALVKGRPPALRGTIDAPLGRDRRRRTRMSSDTDNPRDAITHFAVEQQLAGATLLEVRLETGRTHQIRAHLKAIGLPVVGDPEYGVPDAQLHRQFLHARRLAFAGREWRSPLPEDLVATLRRYGNPTPDA
jgi:23S rRNA pseudouridine1911/1915/1917 synthase